MHNNIGNSLEICKWEVWIGYESGVNINIFTKICAGDIGHDRMKLKDYIGWMVGGVKCSLMYNYTSIVGEGSKDNTQQ